jgi:RhtB (resistance to homoserine/threonine) family protein
MDPALVLGGIFAVHVAAIASPGPNVLIVTQTAMSRTRRAGVAAALGIAAGAAVWSGSVVLGLSALLARFAWLHGALRLLGGLYLVYLGIRLWRAAAEPLAAGGGPGAASATDWPAFRRGLLTNLTNPKAALFYGGVFAAFLAPDLPAWVPPAAVALIFVNSAAWHGALAWLFSTPRAQRAYARLKRWIDRGSGAALGALGLAFLLAGR